MPEKPQAVSYLRFDKTDYTIHEHRLSYDGFFKLSEYKISHKLFNGGTSEVMSREIFERGDAVVMLPYDPVNDTLVFNEQFRPGVMGGDDSPWLLEFVAGMFGENESPVEVAIREAQEEANLDIEEQNIYKIMEYYSSAGGTSEKIHLYIAKVDSTGVGGVYGLPEECEDIKIHVIKRETAMQLLAEGKIINAAAIIGLQWLQMNYQSFGNR